MGRLGDTLVPGYPLKCIGMYVARPLPVEPDLSPETPYLGLGIFLSPIGDTYLLFERLRLADPE